MSNWHLCGASDSLTSVGFDHRYGWGLKSFVVAFALRAAAGRQMGEIEAYEKINYRVMRNQRWGDGPEVRAIQTTKPPQSPRGARPTRARRLSVRMHAHPPACLPVYELAWQFHDTRQHTSGHGH